MGAFPNTEWSLVDRAGGDGSTVRHEALSQLLERYQPALLAHLVRHKRINPEWAEDLVQGFICNKILEKGLIGTADRQKGRFRTLLLTALDRYVIDCIRHDRRWNARLDEQSYQHEADSAPCPSRAYETAWARRVIEQTCERMEEYCQDRSKHDQWELFKCRVLDPILLGVKPKPYQQLIDRFGYRSPQQVFNKLHAAKRIFAKQLREVVREYAGMEAVVEEEIRDLIGALSKTQVRT